MTAIEEFERLCQPASIDDLNRLVRRASTHVDRIAEAALDAPDLPTGLAAALAEGLDALVLRTGTFDAEQRSWVAGAISYFILTSDANDDLSGPHGLDDDLVVFNEVCERLDQMDLMIQP